MHEIFDTLLAKGRGGSIDDRSPLLQGQIFNGAAIEKIAEGKTVLGQCLESGLIERQQRGRFQGCGVKLAGGILQQFPLTKVFTRTDFSGRTAMIVHFDMTSLNQVERESGISNMVDRIALLQMDTSKHLGYFDVEQANIPGKQ